MSIFGLPSNLKRKLTSRIFGSTENDQLQGSYVQKTPVSSGFYVGKEAPFNYNSDLGEDTYGAGETVHWYLTGIQSFLTTEEINTLEQYFSNDYHWEIRIITHNQRPTRRRRETGPDGHGGANYPRWQAKGTLRDIMTPYDLSDVGTMLGYRGNDLFNYNNSWPTGIISYDSTKHTAPYYLNNSLIGQTGHHPKAASHTHPAWGEDYAAWGYPAILNKGHSRLFINNVGDTAVLDDYLSYAITAAYTQTFRMGVGTFSSIDTQYHSLTGDYYFNPWPSDWFRVDPTTATVAPKYEHVFATYQYKQAITWSTINKTGTTSGHIWYPIVLKAAAVLGKRDHTTYNTTIPDCFDYTIALVCYYWDGDYWKVFDMIFDRLRTIDRWDIDRIETYTRFHHIKEYKHPTYKIISANSAWIDDGTDSYNNHFWKATFSYVPNQWRNKYFNGNGSLSLGIDYYMIGGSSNWAWNNSYIITAGTKNGTKSIYPLPIGSGAYGFPPGFSNDMSVSAAYNPNQSTLTVRIACHSGYAYLGASDIPLLVLNE